MFNSEGRAFTGAWIETVARNSSRVLGQVAPSRARGLKPPQDEEDEPQAQVAPSRARGLKQLVRTRKEREMLSRLHGRVD